MNLPFQVVVTDPRVMQDGKMNQFLQGTPEAAGFDLTAWPEEPFILKPGEVRPVSTGVKLWINAPGFVGLCFPRSGMGAKKGLVIANGTGVIDSDYQGPAMVYLWNRNLPTVDPDGFHDDQNNIEVKPGDRVAQIVFVPVVKGLKFHTVEEFGQATVRGGGGFGSTGRGVEDRPQVGSVN